MALKNKFGITDSSELARVEEKISKMRAIELFENPRYLEQAKEEFEKRAAGGYYCPVPDDAVPTVVGGKMD